jgi:hypothetical protein
MMNRPIQPRSSGVVATICGRSTLGLQLDLVVGGRAYSIAKAACSITKAPALFSHYCYIIDQKRGLMKYGIANLQ